MTFALDNDPDNSEISNSINYLLANLPVSLGQNISNGQITNSNGAVVSYLYKYLQVKYANSFDGTLGFSDVPTGTTYFGLRNSNSNVESTTPSDYIWTLVTGGFGISKHLYYVTTGGRQIQVFVGTTPPASYWGTDPGPAIDLDVITSLPNATGGGGGLTMMGLDGESGEDGFPVPGPAGINGATGSQGPQGVATYLEAEIIEPEMFLVPGTPGPAGNPGAIGPAGSNGFGIDGEDGIDGMPVPGPIGPQGVQGIQGISGSNGFGLDGQDGDDGLSIVGPQGLQGLSGPAGTSALPIALDGSDGDDGMPIPGPQGIQGIAGTSGANGPAVYLEADYPEPDWMPIPGATGPSGIGVTGSQGPIGPAVYLEAPEADEPMFHLGDKGAQGATGSQGPSGPAVYLEAAEADEPMYFQGPQGNSGPTGLLAVSGGLTANTAIAATVTPTTGGITLLTQSASTGSVWRIKAIGTFTAVSSVTARSATITPFWGATALTAITVGAVLVSVAQTTNFDCEFILTSSSTTAIWTTGRCLNEVASATLLALSNATPASTTVTAGGQTIDLRFSMSVVVAGDTWSVQQVTIERIK